MYPWTLYSGKWGQQNAWSSRDFTEWISLSGTCLWCWKRTHGVKPPGEGSCGLACLCLQVAFRLDMGVTWWKTCDGDVVLCLFCFVLRRNQFNCYFKLFVDEYLIVFSASFIAVSFNLTAFLHKKLIAESGHFKNLLLFYFLYTSISLVVDQPVSAVLAPKLEWSCALGDLGTLADICLGTHPMSGAAALSWALFL